MMKKNSVNKLVIGFLGLALLISACGPSETPVPTPDIAAVATQAAMTVEARFTEQALQPTQTPQPTATVGPATATPTAPAPPTLASGGGSGTPCLSASFIADISVPDGMLMDPSTSFTKTWRVQNKGTCTWDSSYSLVFTSGDLLADAYSYPLSRTVAPEQIVDLSIPMVAPSTPGTYYSEWRLQTPWGGTMGFGQYDAPLSVKINADPKGDFGISNVKYTIIRDPLTTCPAKGTRYTITAEVTANATGNIHYFWKQLPDDDDPPEMGQLIFREPGTKTVSFTWLLQPDAVQGILRKVIFVVDAPYYQEYGSAEFVFNCP